MYPPKDAAFCFFLSEFHFWRLGRLFSELLLFMTIYIKLLFIELLNRILGLFKEIYSPTRKSQVVKTGDNGRRWIQLGVQCWDRPRVLRALIPLTLLSEGE